MVLLRERTSTSEKPGKHRAPPQPTGEQQHGHAAHRDRTGRVRRAIGKALPFALTAVVSAPGGAAAANLLPHGETHSHVPVAEAERVADLGKKAVKIYERALATHADVDGVWHSRDGRQIRVTIPTSDEGEVAVTMKSSGKANVNGWTMPDPRKVESLNFKLIDKEGTYTAEIQQTAQTLRVSSTGPNGNDTQIFPLTTDESGVKSTEQLMGETLDLAGQVAGIAKTQLDIQDIPQQAPTGPPARAA